MTDAADVLVIGAGPAGAAAAYWLAANGHRVVVVERRTFPRSKACGDLVTPRAVQQLEAMGLGDALGRWHRIDGLQLVGHGRDRRLAWPRHPDAPDHAVVARRRELDELVAHHAADAGAEVLFGHDAVEPIVERGFVRGAVVRSALGALVEVHASYVVVADGANSTFGRALGTSRSRDWPWATAIRSYWPSPRHADASMEVSLDIVDRQGVAVPAYGWVAPVGDGTVNAGVGLLSTARDFKSLNVAHLLDAYVADAAERWQLDPGASTGVVRVGRVPMGASVQPNAGPTFLVVGDAAGAASPFTGAGIDAAYETGRLAAQVLDDALGDGGPTALQRYPRLLADAYGDPYKSARLWDRLIARSAVVRRVGGWATRSQTVADAALRIMTGSLRDDAFALPEAASRAATAVLRAAPDA
jgi:geranylgeranyl reductase family protein